MKHILVCVKAVPVSSSVEVDGQHRLKRDGASLQWNIADESALEAAVRLADKDGSVTVLTMGPPKLEDPLLELLARGASRAGLITDRLMAGADTRATARALASAAEKLGPFDAVFCGCKAIDGETGQVPGELAAALGLPGRWWEPLYLLAGAQAVLGCFNLLPILPLDGGRMLWLALCWGTDPFLADRVTQAVSLAAAGLLTVAGAALARRSPFLLWTAAALLVCAAEPCIKRRKSVYASHKGR